jgi:hypothetical protein
MTPRRPRNSRAYARAALGDEAFARAWDTGQAMTLEQAISDALAGNGT